MELVRFPRDELQRRRSKDSKCNRMTSFGDKLDCMPGRKTTLESSSLKSSGRMPPLPVTRWLFSRLSVPARILLLAGTLLATVCLFFAEENWRGRRAWKSFQRELQANGVELDWKKFVPPPVADDQNFAETAFLAPLFDFNRKPRGAGQTIWRDKPGHDRAANFGAALLPVDNKGYIPSDRLHGEMTDLEGALLLLQSQDSQSPGSTPTSATRAQAAAAVLIALNEYQPVLNELRLASGRPHSRFNIDYDAEDPISILLPHYQVLQRVSRVLEVRASAELALQKSDAAFDDVQLMSYLAGSTRAEPFLMGLRSRGSMWRRTEQIIWEGLAGRHWTQAQLEALERELKSNQMLKQLENALCAERAAFGESLFRYIRSHKNVLRSWIASTDEAGSLMYLLAGPSGWFYQEQVSYHRLYDKRVLAGFDASAGRVHPGILDENRKSLRDELQHSSFWHHTGFSKIMLGEITKTIQKAAIDQNRADQTMIACALERFRLAKGKYPETLEVLAPQFIDSLPLDVCSGRSLKYRLLQDGRFALYGVGWNETDDGGVAATKQGTTDDDPDRGDWVWPQYPQK